MNWFKNLWYSGYWAVALILLTACQNDDDVGPDNDRLLVSQEEVGSFTSEQLAVIAAFTGYSEYQDLIEYGLTLYKISYNTEFQGEPVVASGIISVPQGEASFPLVLSGHGTIMDDEKAPSNLSINFNQNNASGFELLAAFGFISVIPDYLGFGTSADIAHPYFDYTASARPSVDMLRAVQEFLEESGVDYQSELFLTGYSQGGYVTIATLKYLEENPDALPDFSLEAAAAGAGGYDIREGMETIFEQDTYPSPANLAFLVYSYHQTNGWERPLTDFFQEPYASRVPGLFDGSTSAGTINAQLPQELSALFRPEFIANMRSGSETEFLTALEANSVHDWAPQTTVRLYHAVNDEVVPLQNSESTYRSMMQNGAENVFFFPYNEGESHRAGAQPMYEQVIPWFVSLRNLN